MLTKSHYTTGELAVLFGVPGWAVRRAIDALGEDVPAQVSIGSCRRSYCRASWRNCKTTDTWRRRPPMPNPVFLPHPPMPPPADNPLDRILAQLAAQAKSARVRRWAAELLERGESASGTVGHARKPELSSR